MRRVKPPIADVTALTVGVLGGTGEQGRGLAIRFVTAGLAVRIGSRDASRAQAAAAEIAALTGAGPLVRGDDNATVAQTCDPVIVAVPWAAHEPTLRALSDQLADTVVIDCVNPLGFDRQGPYGLEVPQGSAAEQAQALLPRSRVTAAFHHVSAILLADLSVTDLALDVLVLGDDRDATDLVRGLAELLPGVRGIYGGRLRNAGQVERLTANLIAVNRRYQTHAGIRITRV